MKLFTLIQTKYSEFESAVRNYLSKTLNNYGTSTSNSSIFGQLINVLGGAIQNVLSYVEDGITEQNKLTAQRKRSIYSLAAISGYNPSLGTAATGVINLSFKPNNESTTLDIIISNHTKLSCSQNGLTYSIILPQEAIILSPYRDNISKYLSIVEGTFENQTFVASGGAMYTQNVAFNGDSDISYLEVYVNNTKWTRVDHVYDMDPEGLQYAAKTSLKTGIDLTFGNSQYGKEIQDTDTIKVIYLIHTGEYGNLDPNEEVEFTFTDNLEDISGNNIDGNKLFNLAVQDKDHMSGGTFSEDIQTVRTMIGLNSRSLVLADPKNYKLYLSKFSFCGYSRTWCEKGSLVVNSLIVKNYKSLLTTGSDYFNLTESDFILTDTQKDSVVASVVDSGQQLAGAVFNIFDPEICKYAMYVYVKLKDDSYDTDYITSQIRNLIGSFFADLGSDIFIPKSDITHLLKTSIDQIDGVDVYFLSELNEEALKDRYYMDKTYTYNPSKDTYDIKEEKVYLYDGENPGLGLDAHGNIYLDNTDRFPVLMGGWSFISSDTDNTQTAMVTDPLNIIYD